MKFGKRIERFGKRTIRNILRGVLNPVPLKPEDFDPGSISKILVVRQDSRLGNLVLMTPLISGLKRAFPVSRVDVLISEGFEEIYEHNPTIDNIIVFEKKKARFIPWWYPGFVRNLRKEDYDLAIDVSDGYHFSLNNVILTSISGARYRLGYDRGDAQSFLNLLVPLPPEDTHVADAMLGLVTYISPDMGEFRLSFDVSDTDSDFAQKWLEEHHIRELDSFFVIHPGGRGRKQWGARNFAALIDRIYSEIGLKIVVMGGSAEDEMIAGIREMSSTAFDILQDITIGQMAAVIERCNMFIGNDTGPMHVSSALGRPTVGIFISSDFRVYGPRGKHGRIVLGTKGQPSIDDVLIAVMDLMCTNTQTERSPQ